MQRKTTPLSHPFHGLCLALALILLCPVLSHANTVFHIECPPDVTVNCDAELWDLSVYGNAVVVGYNGPEPAGPPVSEDYNLGNCNTGTIVRTWVAYDYGGYPHTCAQTITVTGTGGGANIQWPPDYIIHACNPETAPEDLPVPYNWPIFGPSDGCSMLLTNFEDLVFDINPPACRKILRKWTVIDWCLFDPHDYDPIGIWTYTQVIKVAPENAPLLNCPADVTVSAGGDCTGGYVQLPLAYGSTDCGAGVIITNNSPYAFEHGPDASGNYPPGTTKVTFWADDGCGGKTSCSMYITVTDLKKPTPICYYGVTVNLMQMPDGYYMDLRPEFLDKGSFDNCTPSDDLVMWIEPSRVSCEHLGQTVVRLYVQDASGNIEYCTTIISVQDNNGVCPPDNGVINGTISTTSGSALHDVKVSLHGTPNFAMTGSDGEYAFPPLPFGSAYSVEPAYPVDGLSGVTAIDMVLLLKHILGIETFQSPYQYIAADMDQSGHVSVNDLLKLKELILQEYYGLNPATSWRFIDASYVFQNPANPLAESFPESYVIANLTSGMNDLDFIGIKLGDMSNDAEQDLQGSAVIATRSQDFELTMNNPSFEKGDVVEAIVSISDYQHIAAMQFALEVDPTILEVVDLTPLQHAHGFDILDKSGTYGVISGLWYGFEQLGTAELFQVKFQALRDGEMKSAVALKSELMSVAYDSEDQVSSLTLHFTDSPIQPSSEPEPKMTLRIGQNYPNPFTGTTTIPLHLSEAGEVLIQLYDLTGQELWSDTYNGIKGIQEITLTSSVNFGQKVILCSFTSQDASASLLMLSQDSN